MILVVGIGFDQKIDQPRPAQGITCAPPGVHDHAEIPSTISLKCRPRWAEIRTVPSPQASSPAASASSTLVPSSNTVDFLFSQFVKAQQQVNPAPLYALLKATLADPKVMEEVRSQALDSVVTSCGMMALFIPTALLRCPRRFIDTIYQIGTGNCSNPTCLDEREFGAGLRGTTANSSTPCSGFFAPVRRGETCRSRTVGGKTPIGVFVAGATRAFGSRSWSSALMSPISSGS